MTDVARQATSSERLAAFLDTIDLPPFQKELLRNRWLDQIGWMSRQAKRARRRYLAIRLPVVIGGVLIPPLITILLSHPSGPIPWLFNVDVDVIRLVSFAVSLLVAALAAADEVLHYAERWRHYRRTAELLKTLGYQYLMLNGAFRRYANHSAAFAAFTERVEDVLNEDVEGYFGSVAAEGSAGEKRHEVVA